MKLYYSSFTRSGRARWMLEEIGVAYEIARLSLQRGEHKAPEYLEIHPHGSVPALTDGDLKIYESSAILLHLADRYPTAMLAPPLGSDERGEYYRWLVYVPATVDPVLEAITTHTRMLPEPRRIPAVADEARRKLAAIARVLARAVAGKQFIVGGGFTAADIAVASAVGWMGLLGALEDQPALRDYLQVHQQRPAFQSAHAD